MNNISLYRKYRPNNFDEVVGQDNIVKTLVNEINTNKLTHAYLFSGPRGCGKTSIAKIFGKEINGVEHTNYVDIWEMDAASNNSVEEIRKVIDNVNYLPVELKYKVYIIDEVHMLSKAAFNALLKTLEEPPSYAIFILATTEIQKIPATIISRCQRFDFNRIAIEPMVNRMKEVLKYENVTYDEMALLKIAELSDGALRDCLSILESVVNTQGHVDMDGIANVLNIVNDKDIEVILNYIDEKEVEQLLKHYKELKIKGIDDVRFLNDIINHIKNKIVYSKNYYYAKYLPALTEASFNIEHSKAKSLVMEVLFVQLCDLEIVIPPEIKSQHETEETYKQVSENVDLEMQVDEEILHEKHDGDNFISDSIEEKIEEEIAPIIEESPIEFGFIDVLKNATNLDKEKYISNMHIFKEIAENKNIRSIALFFEEAQVVAASPNAIILSTNDTYVNDFIKKIDDIRDIIINVESTCQYVFLIGHQEWAIKRPRYIEEIKKEKTIYDIAVENFGSNIVRKV